MSYGILNPNTGFQARGMLSPGLQATGVPQQTQGVDLSQYAVQTQVPAEALAQPVQQSMPTSFPVPQYVRDRELFDHGYSDDIVSHSLLMQGLMPAGGATEKRREFFESSPLSRFNVQDRYRIYNEATKNGVQDSYNLGSILQALYG
jgi:hypothetical protein